MDARGFEQRSELEGVSQAEVWDRVASWAGVNHELGPLLTMSYPARYEKLSDVPADGRSHFTSYLLLGRVLPFDAHRLAFRELVSPSHFDERSSNGLLREWSHYRSVTPTERGVVVLDRCSLVPRIPGTGALLAWIYATVFRRRHRRLRAWFARDPANAASASAPARPASPSAPSEGTRGVPPK